MAAAAAETATAETATTAPSTACLIRAETTTTSWTRRGGLVPGCACLPAGNRLAHAGPRGASLQLDAEGADDSIAEVKTRAIAKKFYDECFAWIEVFDTEVPHLDPTVERNASGRYAAVHRQVDVGHPQSHAGLSAGAALEKLPWSQGLDRYLDYYHTLLR